MNAFWRYLAVFVIGVLLAQRPPTGQPPAPPPTPTPTEPQAFVETATAEVELEEQIFGYEVLSDVLKRTVDGVRFVDTMLAALLAAQTAIYALLIDKFPQTPIFWIFQWALGLSGAGLLQTIFVREAPKAHIFAEAFPKGPSETRNRLVRQFVALSGRNAFIRTIKLAVFLGSLGLTLWGLLAPEKPHHVH